MHGILQNSDGLTEGAQSRVEFWRTGRRVHNENHCLTVVQISVPERLQVLVAAHVPEVEHKPVHLHSHNWELTTQNRTYGSVR